MLKFYLTIALISHSNKVMLKILQDRLQQSARVQPWLIQGVQSGDGVGEDQDTIASIRY